MFVDIGTGRSEFFLISKRSFGQPFLDAILRNERRFLKHGPRTLTGLRSQKSSSFADSTISLPLKFPPTDLIRMFLCWAVYSLRQQRCREREKEGLYFALSDALLGGREPHVGLPETGEGLLQRDSLVLVVYLVLTRFGRLE